MPPCASCNLDLPKSKFSKNQLRKAKRKCISCVEQQAGVQSKSSSSSSSIGDTSNNNNKAAATKVRVDDGGLQQKDEIEVVIDARARAESPQTQSVENVTDSNTDNNSDSDANVNVNVNVNVNTSDSISANTIPNENVEKEKGEGSDEKVVTMTQEDGKYVNEDEKKEEQREILETDQKHDQDQDQGQIIDASSVSTDHDDDCANMAESTSPKNEYDTDADANTNANHDALVPGDGQISEGSSDNKDDAEEMKIGISKSDQNETDGKLGNEEEKEEEEDGGGENITVSKGDVCTKEEEVNDHNVSPPQSNGDDDENNDGHNNNADESPVAVDSHDDPKKEELEADDGKETLNDEEPVDAETNQPESKTETENGNGDTNLSKENSTQDAKAVNEIAMTPVTSMEEEEKIETPNNTTTTTPTPTISTATTIDPVKEEKPAEISLIDKLNEYLPTGQRSAPNRIFVGICAMDKKARSKPMGEILSRLDGSLFEIVYFGDDLILNSPVEDWPLCDVLIAFYSNGYPLEKAEEYAELRKPFLLNDLKMQHVLKDRRRVYDLLEASGIDVPRHVFMNRDGYVPGITTSHDDIEDDCDEEHEESTLVEYDDHIEVDGVVIHKPFVEKPVDADDHNIAIYYPSSAGGGCKKLFRKIGDRSSEFYPHINEIRRDGSFIYEEFVETQGTDVKMYTVGPDYGHAEARKSPTVDGKVERNEDGKEVRFPVILTLREKEIARRIVLVFKQYVCGFDLLRVQEGDSLVSYVCDVNGWSFVKKSRKYYDDCAQILTEHILAAVKPKALCGFSALDPLLTTMKDTIVNTPRRRRKKMSRPASVERRKIQSPDTESETTTGDLGLPATLEDGAKHVRELPDRLMNTPASICASAASSLNGDDETVSTTTTTEKRTTVTHQEELRCVIAIVRHGDRTPKQKLKVNMSEPLLLDYFHRHATNAKKDLKVKAKKPMTEFLETVKAMIAQKQEDRPDSSQSPQSKDILYKLLHMRDVLERWKIGGLNRKLQLKPRKWDEYTNEEGKKVLRCAELQLILKWGGNLTKLGEKQAINLGAKLRERMYPNTPGGGILRLHSTFRHDMKIKTSDEGRVMKTAAAFAKGMLELEGSIPPILVSLVHKEKDSLHMLDPSGNKEVKVELEACKKNVNSQFQQDFDVSKADPEKLETLVGPNELKSLHTALRQVGNPRQTLFAIRDTIGELLVQLDDMLGGLSSDFENKHEGGEGLKGNDDDDEALSGIKLYKGETLLELTERWRLLHKKLYNEEDNEFDLSRVPDVHDNVRFDMLHNPHLGLTATLEKLYNLAKNIADCVVPQEYGSTIKEKRSIGNKMCRALLEKIKYDLIIARTDNQVDMRYMINLDYSADLPINTMGRRIRTRLYFTSESHLHTLLNVLRFPSEGSKLKSPLSRHGISVIASSPELCYLTQVVLRLFENPNKDPDDPKRFRIEILFSPGATATPLHMSELKRDEDASRFDTEPVQLISSDYLTCQEIEDYFSESIKEGEIIENPDDDAAASIPKSKDDKKKKQSKDTTSVDQIPPRKESRSVIIAEDKNTEFEPPVEVILGAAEEDEFESSSVQDSFNENEHENERGVIDKKIDAMARILSKQFFWTSVAAASFVLGVGFIVLSREVVKNDFKTRRWSRR